MSSQVEERVMRREYKLWKKKAPFEYDSVSSHLLNCPSLTVEWLPIPGIKTLILGTLTANRKQNYLILAHLSLSPQNDHHRLPVGKVEIVQQIIHDGAVTRARHLPQNPFIIATKTITADVNVFDYSKHPSRPPLDGICNPDLRLKGQSAKVYGGIGNLSWSQFKNGHLLSGSYDTNIYLWDINATPQNKDLNAMQTYKIEKTAVEDVAWDLKHEYLFGSVGDDQYLHMWDVRTPSVTKPVQSVVAHEGEVNCLAFNPFNEWMVATGSNDTTVKLFDLRKLTNAMHSLDFHEGEVLQVGWNPKNESVLASCCCGRRLLVWDISRIDDTPPPEDAEDGPPELLFTHAGHTSNITDFSWNPCEDWLVASVAVDDILQIWKMAERRR